MSLPEEFVSLHPYFKVHPGKLEEAKSLLPSFIEKTKTEERMLFYGFTLNGDEVFCREAYVGAEGACRKGRRVVKVVCAGHMEGVFG